ncbi:T9SS type A sorting domain-containing protein [Psychroserpens luteolus]|uniref:T9SS type A sorting domain-containing protein n=1 Tax=Psychroserpens luteolus TaxID=2855840 RepID=UPI001E3537D6|nr:T9SS type A sorting domain-containing protein [Psychroserpens luteolus]MCD2260716.1 carboxypeptidase-like regulatory domain-containing protein [Psychroserpens luteolus]
MKQIVLALTTFLSLSSFAQTTIKGTISDGNDDVPFSNIMIKHSSKGVLADEKGRFSIEAKSTDTLQISNLGYRTQEIVVGKQKKLNITLKDYEELAEVVVVAYAPHYCSKSYICGERYRCSSVGVLIKPRYIKDKEQNEIMLYPNPSKDGIFNIKSNDDFSDVKVVVADLTGRIILSSTYKNLDSNVSVDLSNQPSGIYIINLQSNGKTIASKKAIRV